MSIAFGLYVFGMATVVSLAAWLFERICISRCWSRRWVWFSSVLISCALPIILMTVRTDRPTEPTWIARPWTNAIQSRRLAHLSEPLTGQAAPPPTHSTLKQADVIFRSLWVIGSMGVLCFYAIGTTTLRRRARSWSAQTIEGHRVLVTDGPGPAVLGHVRPRILLPKWLLDCSHGRTRRLVLAHERQHIEARDPLMMLSAFVIVALLPWCVPLWWQLRRLRFAIEVDCDRRVVRGAGRLDAYARTLLSVGCHRERSLVGVMALGARPSQLEQRVRAMTDQADRRLLPSLAIACCGFALVGVCSQFAAPSLNSSYVHSPQPRFVSLDIRSALKVHRNVNGELLAAVFGPESERRSRLLVIPNPDREIVDRMAQADLPEILVRGSRMAGVLPDQEPQPSADEEEFDIALDAPTLGQATTELIQQAHIEMLYLTDFSGVAVSRVSGRMTLTEAFSRLLESSPCDFKLHREGSHTSFAFIHCESPGGV